MFIYDFFIAILIPLVETLRYLFMFIINCVYLLNYLILGSYIAFRVEFLDNKHSATGLDEKARAYKHTVACVGVCAYSMCTGACLSMSMCIHMYNFGAEFKRKN